MAAKSLAVHWLTRMGNTPLLSPFQSLEYIRYTSSNSVPGGGKKISMGMYGLRTTVSESTQNSHSNLSVSGFDSSRNSKLRMYDGFDQTSSNSSPRRTCNR